MTSFPDLTDDELADRICTWAGRMAAGMARLLDLVAEFDRREGWAGPGMLSCAHWLSWRIGLAPGTAREWVRVAGRLEQLPAIQQAFVAGRMSWSQVRAVTRVATADDGVDRPSLAGHTSAGQFERIVRGIRRALRVEEVAGDPDLAAYQLRTRHRYDADGNLVLTIYAPAEYAPLVLAGIEAQRAQLDRHRQAEAADRGADDDGAADGAEPHAPDPAADVSAGTPTTAGPVTAEPGRATDAEALLAMARSALDIQRSQQPELARRSRSRLVVQIDPLSGWARLQDGELLPPSSFGSMTPLPRGDGPVRLRPLAALDLTTCDLGRTTREPSLTLRELLGTIDGERCRFSGCTRTRKLHAHHVVFWSNGGCTDLDNLVLLCSRHHTLVHQLGFRLMLRADRRLDVRTAEGTPVLHHPAKPSADPAELETTVGVSAGTPLSQGCDSRMDLGYVVSVLLQQAA